MVGPRPSGYFALSLRQDGDNVTGVACAYESGVRLYANAHVGITDLRFKRASAAACP